MTSAAYLPDEIVTRLVILRQSLNAPQMQVLRETSPAELEALLDELNRRDDGPAAKNFCLDTIYASRNKRRDEEQRAFEATCPPARIDWW